MFGIAFAPAAVVSATAARTSCDVIDGQNGGVNCIADRTLLVCVTLALASTACAMSASDLRPAVNHAPIAALLPILLDDTARRSGVAAAAWRVMSVEAVTWPDGAMGCPQAGRLYTQALVPGHRVRLEAPSGTTLTYHTSERGGWLWCPADRAQPALPRDADPRI